MCCTEPTQTRILFKSGTRTRADPRNALNVLPGPEADPTIIRKLDPNPARKTQTRLHPIAKYCTANCYEVNNELRIVFFYNSLTTVSSLLPDCDAYNPLRQYISINVRLFLSLAQWKGPSYSTHYSSFKSLLAVTVGDGWRMQFSSFLFRFFPPFRINFDCCVYPTITILL